MNTKQTISSQIAIMLFALVFMCSSILSVQTAQNPHIKKISQLKFGKNILAILKQLQSDNFIENHHNNFNNYELSHYQIEQEIQLAKGTLYKYILYFVQAKNAANDNNIEDFSIPKEESLVAIIYRSNSYAEQDPQIISINKQTKSENNQQQYEQNEETMTNGDNDNEIEVSNAAFVAAQKIIEQNQELQECELRSFNLIGQQKVGWTIYDFEVSFKPSVPFGIDFQDQENTQNCKNNNFFARVVVKPDQSLFESQNNQQNHTVQMKLDNYLILNEILYSHSWNSDWESLSAEEAERNYDENTNNKNNNLNASQAEGQAAHYKQIIQSTVSEYVRNHQQVKGLDIKQISNIEIQKVDNSNYIFVKAAINIDCKEAIVIVLCHDNKMENNKNEMQEKRIKSQYQHKPEEFNTNNIFPLQITDFMIVKNTCDEKEENSNTIKQLQKEDKLYHQQRESALSDDDNLLITNNKNNKIINRELEEELVGGAIDYNFISDEHEDIISLINNYLKNCENYKNFEFHSVISAQSQVVSGTKYYLEIKIQDKNNSDSLEIASVEVWEKTWENFLKILSFKVDGTELKYNASSGNILIYGLILFALEIFFFL